MSGETNGLASALDLLCAPKKLDREKGEEQFRSIVLSQGDLVYLCQWIAEKLEGLSNWEDVYGGLTVAAILLENATDGAIKELGLLDEVESRVLECHENEEFRVRIAAGQLMGCLCRRLGLPVFKRFIPRVIQGVTENLERNTETPATEVQLSQRELELAKERDTNLSRSSLSIFHDTAGWKHLETWMKCIQQMVTNLKPEDFVQVERAEILNLIFKAVQHTNRFVRETGYDVLATLIQGHACYSDPHSGETKYLPIANQLVQGLSDNWSQVRMAASRATRIFFDVPPPPGNEVTDAYPILLPAMCLNRYYVAEGVRIYSQDTWCRVTKGEGKLLLGKYLTPAIEFYIKQSDADNHAVREAACASIAEAVSKLDADLLKPHMKSILEALIVCFGDESWPVRDAACGALGTLLSTFPSEAKEEGHKTLMSEQFLRNLSDSIPSVRDGAAYSIARIMNAVSDPEITKLYLDYIRTRLDGVKQQPMESHGAESPRVQGTGPGVSHVVSRSGADAHDARHTDQVMYSCGSLAPKLHKGTKGGCMHGAVHQRPSEPWEQADGAVRLIGQIAEVAPKLFEDTMVDHMIEATSHNHYTHYPYLLETACRTTGQMCNGLQKMQFKRHLDKLLVVLAAAVECQLPLAAVASEETLSILAQRLGPNVLRGRIENHMDSRVPHYLRDLLPRASS
ncbi:unnamed protein product [Calicophoron daubneyi]|uniref:Uncharacterized protein n=1 Tax=Calicophoron daubneyi TaxID=300641 RepID=A0AAV2T554_CALDB